MSAIVDKHHPTELPRRNVCPPGVRDLLTSNHMWITSVRTPSRFWTVFSEQNSAALIGPLWTDWDDLYDLSDTCKRNLSLLYDLSQKQCELPFPRFARVEPVRRAIATPDRSSFNCYQVLPITSEHL